MEDLAEQLNKQRRKVDFDTFDMTVKELISLVADETIDIAPVYQRKFRWEADRQSELIESIFLGIPVPSLYMAANRDGTWELIDGVQRLSSLLHFAGDDGAREILGLGSGLRLRGLKKLEAFNGKGFDDLPASIQTGFRLRPLKVTTITDKSDKKVRFDLFERLNTGGVKLSQQEIRNCVYRGRFNNFLKEMASDDNFREIVKVPVTKEDALKNEDLVLRFFAYLYAYDKFEHSVNDFLNDFMDLASNKFNYKEGRTIFREVFRVLREALPEGITRGRNATPANLYEAVAVGAALAYVKNKNIVTDGVRDWISSKELLEITKEGTNTNKMVKDRLQFGFSKFTNGDTL